MILGNLISKSIILAAFSFYAYSAQADPIPLSDYLETMDLTEVSFSGRIKYDSSEDSFTFYDENREPFGVTIDAGRAAREQIETKCDNPSFFVSYDDLCSISGSGTVEIRGSRIYLSIEAVKTLTK
jgi:hypothetical protein